MVALSLTKQAVLHYKRHNSHSTDDYVRLVMNKRDFEKLPTKQREAMYSLANVVMDLVRLTVENKVRIND